MIPILDTTNIHWDRERLNLFVHGLHLLRHSEGRTPQKNG